MLLGKKTTIVLCSLKGHKLIASLIRERFRMIGNDYTKEKEDIFLGGGLACNREK